MRNGVPTVSTGNPALDDILMGGVTANRLYLIEGDPGSGKTTLALQYLIDGAAKGEPGLYVTLSETKEELNAVARSHGWSLEGINMFELVPSEETLSPDSQYTMFHPSEVELSETTKAVLHEVESTKPVRVVFDSLSEMRLLAQSPLRYRRQILALKQFFTGRQCTVFLLDDHTSEVGDLQLQSIAHGVITLEQLPVEYGAERRRLRVLKMRGQKYRGGYHDFTIKSGGLEIYPRLVAAEHRQSFSRELVSSGFDQLDAMIGGGLSKGSSTLLIGPAGSGKSSIALQYACAAAARGEKAVIFGFDESIHTMLTRAHGVGMPLQTYIDQGLIYVQQIDPAELSPGEFAGTVRAAVEQKHVKIVVIDSLNGYLNAMPAERYLNIQLHELLTYLGQQGVNTILVMAQSGLVGTMSAAVDVSYLADAVMLFRYFEAQGAVRLAMSVMKNRSGAHERTIRELSMDPSGIQIGPPLRNFSGILTGTPIRNE